MHSIDIFLVSFTQFDANITVPEIQNLNAEYTDKLRS
jgi:hypothetical protein